MRFFFLICILFLWNTHSSTAQPASQNVAGKNEAEIIGLLGKPNGSIDFGDKRVLIFNQTSVTFLNHKAIKVDHYQSSPTPREQTSGPIDSRIHQRTSFSESNQALAEPAVDEMQHASNNNEGDASRSAVLNRHLSEIQNGQRVVLPDIDSKTSALKGYKTVDRTLFEKYGGDKLARMNKRQIRDLEMNRENVSSQSITKPHDAVLQRRPDLSSTTR